MQKWYIPAAAVLITVVDQLLKSIAPPSPLPSGGGFFVRTLNHGIAFSLPLPSWLLMALLTAAFIMVVAVSWREAKKEGGRIAPFVFIIAGAVSNIIDRIRVGAVIDYFSIASLGFSFNLADCMIVAGVGMAIIKKFRNRTP